MNYVSFYNLVRTENRIFPWAVRLLYCAYPLLRESVLILGQPNPLCRERACRTLPRNGPFRLSGLLTDSLSCKLASTPQQPCFNKPLPSNGHLFLLDYSEFQPSCHSIITAAISKAVKRYLRANATDLFASCLTIRFILSASKVHSNDHDNEGRRWRKEMLMCEENIVRNDTD
jgi:hypothetical protein